MGGGKKPEGKKFDFKIKIIQTDLVSRNYLRGMRGAFGFDGDMSVFQNSGYVSKLWHINHYSGGILAKDRVEDMPEKYRRFVRPGNASEKEMFKSFKREMAESESRANREEIGQNVFFTELSIPIPPEEAGGGGAQKPPGKAANAAGKSAGTIPFENLEALVRDILYGEEALGDGGEYDEEYGDDEYDDEEEEYDEEYEDDEEIRDILQLNNMYNSEMYKMSKVEYDFNVSGYISLTRDGMIDISYDETEITGIEGSYIRIMFSEKERGVVTFHKKGLFDDWFILEKGSRAAIERSGPGFAAVSTTKTDELKNTMTLAGGELRAVYHTETNGIPTETVSYSLKTIKAKGETNEKPNI